MSLRRIRADVWICMLLGYLIGLLAAQIARGIWTKEYPNYVEEHTVAAGDIGGIAEESVYRAQNVEDLLTHEAFTIIPEEMQGNGYYKVDSHRVVNMWAVTLPSGEVIAVMVNPDSVQWVEDSSIYSGRGAILPVGRVVYADMTKDETFLQQIEFIQPLSRRDFYVDMRGNGGIESLEDYLKNPVDTAQMITVFISVIVLHMIGVNFGIFPKLFPPLSSLTNS